MGHLTKWLFFNLMFGAIPYTLTVALNQLQSPGSPLLHPSSEVLFIAVVATSSALGELWDGDEHAWARPRSPWRGRWQLVLLLGVLSSSLLYGAYVYNSLVSPGRAHGIDCAAIARFAIQPPPAPGNPGDLVTRWAPVCVPWMQVQTGFFAWSSWLTAFWVVVSTTAMHWCRPRGR